MDDKNTALNPSGGNASSPLTPSHQSDMDVPPPPPSIGAPTPAPVPFSPPVVHEEVSEPEAPASPDGSQGGPVTHPPEHDDAPPVSAPPPTSPPPAGGNFGRLPPVITPPTKNGNGKIIAVIAAVVLLLISIPVGVILVRQNLEVREKAREVYDECEIDNTCDEPIPDHPTPNPNPPTEAPTEAPQQPTQAPAEPDPSPPSDDENECSNEGGSCVGSSGVCSNQGGYTSDASCSGNGICCMGSSGSPSVPTSTPTPTSGISACPGIENAGPLVHAGTEDINLGNQSYADCATVTNFVNQYGVYAGRGWAVERVCGNGNVTAACDGQKLITQSADVVQRLLGANGANACQVWVNQHNTDVNNCTTAPSCVPISVYKYPYDAQFKVANLNSLKPGDPVKFCINASYGGSPQVRINGGSWRVAQENGSNGEKCFQYDIPGDATTLTVEGQL